MERFFSTILAFITAAVFAVSAQQPAPTRLPAGHKAAHEAAAATNAADRTFMASVPHINPLDIVVPPAKADADADADAVNEMTADMLGFARKFIGTRYRSGGKAPKTGFDCSGFTGYVFRNFGISLGASSRDQYKQGHQVKRSEIQPGDLLFFGGRGRRGIGHVGIAVSADPVTGEVTFIHSASSRGVRIDRLSAPYYAARYVGARRVLPD